MSEREPTHVCDVAGCEQGFPTMEDVVAHERTHADRLDSIRERLAAATPGPWESDWLETGDGDSDASFVHIVRAPGQDAGNGESLVCDVGWSPRRKTLPDAAFIAHAPDDIAHLLDRLETAEASERRLRDALRAVEAVEPSSGTAYLGIVDWANALDKAQHIATLALDADSVRAPSDISEETG